MVHETKHVNNIISNTARCITCTKFNKAIARCKKIYLVHGIQILSVLGAANLLGALHYLVQENLVGALHLFGAGKSTWCTAFKYFHQATLLGAANLLGALHLRETANCMEVVGENLNVGTCVPYFIQRVT